MRIHRVDRLADAKTPNREPGARINYAGRIFRTVENLGNGDADSETVFHYHHEGNIVWATYSGGDVAFGTLLAAADADGCLDMRYQHLSRKGEWKAGVCRSVVTVLADGRYRMLESWRWTTGDRSSGNSVVEEVRE